MSMRCGCVPKRAELNRRRAWIAGQQQPEALPARLLSLQLRATIATTTYSILVLFQLQSSPLVVPSYYYLHVRSCQAQNKPAALNSPSENFTVVAVRSLLLVQLDHQLQETLF